MARGAVVVILSDGWDRGDARGARPSRWRGCTGSPTASCGSTRSRRRPGYAPLARGMAAALPYVDEFVEGHSLASLEHLVERDRR